MPIYTYEGFTKDGEKTKGQLNAKNEKDLRLQLRKIQIRPIRIQKPSVFEVDLVQILGLGGGSASLKEKDLAIFTRQFATMVNSGVPILQALDIQIAQAKDKGAKRILTTIREKVSEGSTLWMALGEHKKSFDNLYVNMIRAGEAGGILDIILERLSGYIEKAVKLKRMVKGAMMYPAIISLVGIGVVAGMLYFVIPKFEAMLKDAGQELPAPTQFVIGLSHWLQGNIFWLFPGFILFVMGFINWKKSPAGKPIWDRLVLKFPIFGDLAMKSSVARFSRTLSTLLSSGVGLIEALSIAQAVLENRVFENALARIKEDVQQGQTISDPMAKSKIFPDLAVQMISVGESTGELDNMLSKVADYYEEEVEALISNMSKLIEPFVLIFLGGLVGGILIAMYLPIFKLAGGVG